MRIIFMGTPDFAVESLKVLFEHGYDIAGVVTMPDKPAGRGQKIRFSAVKQYALEHNLPLLQPEKLKDEVFLQKLRDLQADLQIVVAFRMLPEEVWGMPSLGTFNLHASLLPQYRGAAPINWAIINGEELTGLTTFFLTHEIDTGKIILQEQIAIGNEDNAGTLHDKLMVMGAQMVKKTVDLIAGGKVDAVEQSAFLTDNIMLKPAPKLFKENCRIDFSKSVHEVHNQVRGLSPYPGAWTEILLPGRSEPMICKVFTTEKEYEKHHFMVGSVHTDGKKYLKIALKDGFIKLTEIQAPGKKRMETDAFLRGMK